MKVKNMDQYFKVMGFIPSNATKVWGTLTVIDLSTNTVIAVVEVNEVDGMPTRPMTGPSAIALRNSPNK